uniref:Transposon protein, putative, CACTA, En/Spm sub-class n=2 Tax=Oryza sativa subsp. japonica TaxID=39947 RepID=Q53JV9_ORYSJ|nr:transposon protein, putative, CACTA, En/Spm sub-class [Oryza sativa Japonica Group]ABA93088.1 transposon protein, putative, CACTA, En/Spm sub-class [Oryza sativa Japonica Group]
MDQSNCKNENMFDSGEDVHGHLIQRGFIEGHTCWVKHGEQELGSGAAADRSGAHNQEDENEHEMFIPSPLGGEMVDVDHDLLQDMLRDVEDPAQNERDGMKFSRLAMLPVENTLPKTIYDAKQVLCPLGLEQYADLDACPVCKASRYKRKKSADEGNKSKRGGPAKVVWYLPIIDRFKRIFANPNEAKLVRWHATERRNDGPRQPGNDIDVFLEPVIDDLEILWKEGVETWDAHGQENFKLRVLLFCTINDYPALGNLSGQTIKGKKACSDCKEHTRSRWLKKSRKMVYMGHLRWLPLCHTFRRKKKIFNGKRELQPAPKDLSGDEVHNMVKDISNEFGKKRKQKNVCESLVGLMLNIPGKTKDGLNARLDLQDMNIRSELQSIRDAETVAIRGILPPKVRYTIQRLCAFFNAIGQKVIDPEDLDGLQTDIMNTLCHLEMFFPLSFFDIMVHLPVHLVKQTKLCGPAFLREMWPFERYIGVVKSYVRNRAKPEGSIIEGYTTEDAIEFCVNYMSDADPIGVPASRHEGRLSGVGTIGRKRIRPDQASYAQAHYAMLQHMAEVGPYFEEHLAKIRDENLGRSDAWINREHNSRFNEWFKNRVTMSMVVPNETVQLLGMGPSWTIDTWQGYDINGYTFYTVKQDDKSTVQNSGIRIDAFQDQVGSNTYYGHIEEIWELNYVKFKVPLFRCRWVNLRTGVKADKEGFTLVDLSKVGYAYEPFVLAKQVEQIFYIKDPSNKKMHIVRDGKRRIVGVDNVVDEEENNHNLHIRPHIDLDDDPQEPVAYARSDHTEGITLWLMHLYLSIVMNKVFCFIA